MPFSGSDGGPGSPSAAATAFGLGQLEPVHADCRGQPDNRPDMEGLHVGALLCNYIAKQSFSMMPSVQKKLRRAS